MFNRNLIETDKLKASLNKAWSTQSTISKKWMLWLWREKKWTLWSRDPSWGSLFGIVLKRWWSSIFVLPQSRVEHGSPFLPPAKDNDCKDKIVIPNYDLCDPSIQSLINKLVLGENFLKGFKIDWNKLERILKEWLGFFSFFLPRKSKVNSQFWTGFEVCQ